jgi:hypothetical protein
MSPITPGQAAFDKWREMTNRTASIYRFTWDEFSDQTRSCWEEVAQAAIETHAKAGTSAE